MFIDSYRMLYDTLQHPYQVLSSVIMCQEMSCGQEHAALLIMQNDTMNIFEYI